MAVKTITEEDIIKAKGVDIVQFLEANGHSMKGRGRYVVTSSPFSSDSNPSFVVYQNDNMFKDFSTGQYGDAIDLAQKMLDCTFVEAIEKLIGSDLPEWEEGKFKKSDKKKKPFSIDNYIATDMVEVRKIREYAESRGIENGYRCGFYYTTADGETWDKNLAIMFPHTDIDGNVIGAKFRNIDHNNPNRFTARGTLGYYILDNIYWANFPVYIVEGEANANSLFQFFEYVGESARVISFGGVGQVPKDVHHSGLLYIIIDYDGDDNLYRQRIRQYAHLNGTPIKLELPKGEDINSLWVGGNYEKLRELL